MKIGRKTIYAINELPKKYKNWKELFDEVIECSSNHLKYQTIFLIQYKRKWYAIHKDILLQRYMDEIKNIAEEKPRVVVH